MLGAGGFVLRQGREERGFGGRDIVDDVAEVFAVARAPTKQQQIDAMVQLFGINQEWMLYALMAGMVGGAATQGISETQLYQLNLGYKTAKDLSDQIAALRAAP